MQLGFVSAILADLSLEEVLGFAAAAGLRDCVELLCWPMGKAERRYAGVTHVDVADFTARRSAVRRAATTSRARGVTISALGYYPNPLAADPAERQVYVDHIKKVIDAAALLGVGVVNTFIGRDHTKSVEDNWPVFEEVWPPLIRFAEQQGVRIGIENCPMLFSLDEWPGGKNLAVLAGDLAADVRGDPVAELRPQLRPVAPGLAVHRLRSGRSTSSGIGSSTSTPRTRRSSRELLYDAAISG